MSRKFVSCKKSRVYFVTRYNLFTKVHSRFEFQITYQNLNATFGTKSNEKCKFLIIIISNIRLGEQLLIYYWLLHFLNNFWSKCRSIFEPRDKVVLKYVGLNVQPEIQVLKVIIYPIRIQLFQTGWLSDIFELSRTNPSFFVDFTLLLPSMNNVNAISWISHVLLFNTWRL